jgi:hypothetical protein
MSKKASVLFVCVHNAGRSQMAAAYLQHFAGDWVEVRSAGSAPANTINSSVVAAMLEEGIDISQEVPKILTTEAVESSDVVITMGCGDACPFYPGIWIGNSMIPQDKVSMRFALFVIRSSRSSRNSSKLSRIANYGWRSRESSGTTCHGCAPR